MRSLSSEKLDLALPKCLKSFKRSIHDGFKGSIWRYEGWNIENVTEMRDGGCECEHLIISSGDQNEMDLNK